MFLELHDTLNIFVLKLRQNSITSDFFKLKSPLDFI